MSDKLHMQITNHLNQYFEDLNGAAPNNLYEVLISAVEKPLLEAVMQRVRGNQSKASVVLGLNRNTVRNKLKGHGMLKVKNVNE